MHASFQCATETHAIFTAQSKEDTIEMTITTTRLTYVQPNPVVSGTPCPCQLQWWMSLLLYATAAAPIGLLLQPLQETAGRA